MMSACTLLKPPTHVTTNMNWMVRKVASARLMVRGMEMNHHVRNRENQVGYERYEQVIHLQLNLDLLVKWLCNFSKS